MYLFAEHANNAFDYADLDTFKNDPEFAMRAVKFNGLQLQYFSDEIKDNTEIVMEAVKNSHKAYRYASEKLRGSVPIFLESITDRDEEGEIVSVNEYDLLWNLDYVLFHIDDDVSNEILELFKKAGLDMKLYERESLRIIIEDLDEKMENPDIDNEKKKELRK